jgi:hypothetical protein
MATEPAGDSVLPLRWTDVLDRVAQALAQVEAAHSNQAVPDAPSSGGDSAWQESLARLGERLRRLDECVAQADETAARVDAALEGSAGVLLRWLAEADAVRARLANGAASSVS